jgi:hypothetical protein
MSTASRHESCGRTKKPGHPARPARHNGMTGVYVPDQVHVHTVVEPVVSMVSLPVDVSIRPLALSVSVCAVTVIVSLMPASIVTLQD